MALDLETEYPAQVDPATAEYPFGQPRNVSLPGAGDGTPWEQALVRDIYGVLQKLLQDAGLVPSGNPDTALASQYLDAMQLLFLNRVELRPGGPILIQGDRLAIAARDGLALDWISGTGFIANIGEARTSGDSTDLVYSASFTKDPTLTWAPGLGGALPVVLSPINQWYRVFLVGKPDGSTDLCIDVNASATNFFTDPAAIADGYTDSTLRRRIGYIYLDAGLTIPKFIPRLDQPGHYVWETPILDITVTTVSSVGRQALVIEHAPPNSLALLNVVADGTQGQEWRISESAQSDNVVDLSNFTLIGTGASKTPNVRGHWLTDASKQIFVRRNGGGGITLRIMTEGWIDSGVFEP